MLAPICLFVYNRSKETQSLLDSLAANPEASESVLYVFSDGAKDEKSQRDVDQTRQVIKNESRFKEVCLHEEEVNKGLAASIIGGVTKVLQQYDKVIVLEDDLEVSNDFLSFMNKALDTYRDRNDIWSISGYTPDITIPKNYHDDVFLVPRAQSWGWATWSDRWEKVDWNVEQFHLLKDKEKRKAFNQGGNDLYRTLDMQQHGKIESWAIRFVFAGFLNHAYTVNPICSKVRNQGVASTTDHQGWNDRRHKVHLSYKELFVNENIQPDGQVIDAFKNHHDLGLISSIGYFLRRYGLGYHQIKKLLS